MKKGYIILLCAFLLSGCVEIRHEVYATGGVEDDAIQTQKEAYTLARRYPFGSRRRKAMSIPTGCRTGRSC